MPARRIILGVILPLLVACSEIPTDSMIDEGPRFASAGAPRFLQANGSMPDINGNMLVTFKLAGLGSNASNVVTASADGSGVWACMTSRGRTKLESAGRSCCAHHADELIKNDGAIAQAVAPFGSHSAGCSWR